MVSDRSECQLLLLSSIIDVPRDVSSIRAEGSSRPIPPLYEPSITLGDAFLAFFEPRVALEASEAVNLWRIFGPCKLHMPPACRALPSAAILVVGTHRNSVPEAQLQGRLDEVKCMMNELRIYVEIMAVEMDPTKLALSDGKI